MPESIGEGEVDQEPELEMRRGRQAEACPPTTKKAGLEACLLGRIMMGMRGLGVFLPFRKALGVVAEGLPGGGVVFLGGEGDSALVEDAGGGVRELG